MKKSNIQNKTLVKKASHFPCFISDIQLDHSITQNTSYKITGVISSIILKDHAMSLTINDSTGSIPCHLTIDTRSRRFPRQQQIAVIYGTINKQSYGNILSLKINFYQITNSIQQQNLHTTHLLKQNIELTQPIISTQGKTIFLRNYVFIICLECFKMDPTFESIQISAKIIASKWRKRETKNNLLSISDISLISLINVALEYYEQRKIIQRRISDSDSKQQIFIVERMFFDALQMCAKDIVRHQGMPSESESFLCKISYQDTIKLIHQRMLIVVPEDYFFNELGLFYLIQPLLLEKRIVSYRNYLILKKQ